MKKVIMFSLASALFLAGCKDAIDSKSPSPEMEQSVVINGKSITNLDVKKVIDKGITKSDAAKGERTLAGATWYFTPNGYAYTTSGANFANASVYISNNNNFPITVTVSGSLLLSNLSLSASTSGCYYTQTAPAAVDVVLGPNNTATLSLKATFRTSVTVEGWLAISQSAPFAADPIYGDDYYYLIKGL